MQQLVYSRRRGAVTTTKGNFEDWIRANAWYDRIYFERSSPSRSM